MPTAAAERRELEAARLARREAALAARPSMAPTDPAPDRLRVATWNLNSLKARSAAVERFLTRVQPDVLCLQETKTAHLSEAVLAMFSAAGYSVAHIGTGAYNGVAVAARHPVDSVSSSGDLGDEDLDREPRLTSCVVHVPQRLRVASVYVPHGRTVDHWHYEFKLRFLGSLTRLVERWLADDPGVLVAGDINVAPTDSDVFHPDAFVGSTHVTVHERAAVAGLLASGLVDVDVQRWGARARRFTWWNHGIGYSRNLGMRLDMIAVDARLASRLDTTWIDHTERGMDRPSDHAALIADFHLPDRAPERSRNRSD
jgi:exodeoxyribonuclease III